MTNLVYRGLGLLEQHFSLYTTIDSEEMIPFLSKFKDLEYANRLEFLDHEGVRAGRRADWIMSLQTLWKYFNEDEYYLKIQTTDQITKTLKKVLSWHHNRTGKVPKIFYSTSEVERFQTASIYSHNYSMILRSKIMLLKYLKCSNSTDLLFVINEEMISHSTQLRTNIEKPRNILVE